MKFVHSLTCFLVIVLLVGCNKSDTSEPLQTETEKKSEQPKKPQLTSVSQEEAKKSRQRNRIDQHVLTSKPIDVTVTTIKGRKLSGLYAEITGISGQVKQDVYRIDYGAILGDLWKKKLGREDASGSTIENADEPIKFYLSDPKTMTVARFVHEANGEVTRVKRGLDFQGVCREYKLIRNECSMFQKLANDVRGIDLIAYGMTEIMPSAEGDLNRRILEILLQNAGSNYLFTIPALYDGMLSLGFYQFTSYAIRHDDEGFVGASVVNKYLGQKDQIPNSVIKLRNGEHHRAAYLFALHNLAVLTKQTTVKEFRALGKVFKQKPADIVTFMATSHHAPSLARKCMRKWLASGAKGSLNPYLEGRLSSYGKKSDNNLAALEKL